MGTYATVWNGPSGWLIRNSYDNIFLNTAKTSHPSRQHLFADSVEPRAEPARQGAWIWGTNSDGWYHLRHARLANVAFADGHAGTQSLAEINEFIRNENVDKITWEISPAYSEGLVLLRCKPW